MDDKEYFTKWYFKTLIVEVVKYCDNWPYCNYKVGETYEVYQDKDGYCFLFNGYATTVNNQFCKVIGEKYNESTV